MRPISEIAAAIWPAARALKSAFFGQYAEDALFFVVFRPNKRGFYVDVGAYDPIASSNTYKLYLKGWRGITVEPNPNAAASFRSVRPRDIHFTEGAASTAKELAWHEYSYASMNTLSPERVEHLRKHGAIGDSKHIVRCRPLQEMIDESAEERQVDFLSVDCEGMDHEVLASIDYRKTRPTVILVEDLEGFHAFRDQYQASSISQFMRTNGYLPIAQALYSTLYIAEDWRHLMNLSTAFDPSRIQTPLFGENAS
jgi:FkbM family methyltransferase